MYFTEVCDKLALLILPLDLPIIIWSGGLRFTNKIYSQRILQIIEAPWKNSEV